MSKGKYYFSKSLEKGLKILTLYNHETPVLTQTEIARALSLNMTSAYRYINTLVELGYLEKNTKNREIRPSRQCLLFCNNLMRATDHLRMIKEVVNRIHSENNISVDVAFVVDDAIAHITTGRRKKPSLTVCRIIRKVACTIRHWEKRIYPVSPTSCLLKRSTA